jgi:predicted phosphodiesterase
MKESLMLPEKVKKEMEKYIKANPDSSHRDIAAEFDISHSTAGYYKKLFLADEADALELDAVKKATEIQRLRDVQRIERGTFRKEARVLNGANATLDALIELVKENPSTPVTYGPKVAKEEGTLIMGLSDLHFGEMVTLPNNLVNTKVLSQRLYKFCEIAVDTALAFGVSRCIFVLTSDMVNSDRRQGELMSNEYNRSHALFNAFEVISAMIDKVSQYIQVTNLTSVIGNEGRVDLDLAFEHKCFMNNFDFILDRMLKAHFPKIVVSNFGNPVERILSVDGVEILLTHGITMAKATPAKQLAYYRQKHGRVDYMISGHLHEALVAPGFSRSGSPVGGNCYSELSLGIAASTPSQTFHIVRGGQMLSFPVDLTSVDGTFFPYTEPPKQRDITQTKEKV